MALPLRSLLDYGALRGFASARSPLSLPKGIVSKLNNVRLDDGSVRIRWGNATIVAYVSGFLSFRGCDTFVMNGVPTVFWAGRDAGRTSVFKSTDGGLTFSLITPAAGAFGDTRFPTDGMVRFALASRDGLDYLVMQNDADIPRLYDGTTTSTVVQTSTAPSRLRTSAALGPGTDFSASPAPTDSNSAKLDGQIKTQGGQKYFDLTVKTTVTPSETSVVTFPSFVFGSDPEYQFLWLVDSGDERWRAVKIEAAATGAGPWTVVYDPDATALVAVDVASSASTAELAGVDAAPILGATVGALRFSYTDDAPASDFSVKFLTLNQSGLVPGGTNFGAAYSTAGSPSISAGAISTLTTSQSYAGVVIPISGYFGYDYTVRVGAVGFPSGRNRYRWYRNDVGTSGYYYITGSEGVSNLWFDNGTTQTDLSKPLPRADAIPLPTGWAMATFNGRLAVGAKNRFYYSASNDPFSFAVRVNSPNGIAEADSAGSFSKPGETVQSIVTIGAVLTTGAAMGQPLNGSISVYVVYTGSTYILSGYDALSLNRTTAVCNGSRSPFSVGKTSGGFYFLDNEGQVRRVLGSDSSTLSLGVVDDQTKAIPDTLIGAAWGCFYDGRYRLAYGVPGQTQNTLILVYNEDLGAFESIDVPFSPPPSALLPYYDASASRVRILGFGATGIAEMEKPGELTDPTGVPIKGTIVFPEMPGKEEHGVQLGGFKLMTDAVVGATAKFSVLCSTGTRTGTINYAPVSLAPNPAGATRAARATETNNGASSLTVVPTLEVSGKGGMRVFRVFVEIGEGPDQYTR